MNALIILLVIIAALIALVLIIALFIKKEYVIQRHIIIHQNSGVVFDYVKYLKNQEHYSKWVRMDPDAKKVYKGTDGTVGFISVWESKNNNVGKGEQEIKKIADGSRIECELRFERPFKNVASTFMETVPVSGNQTNVNWGMNGKNRYPFNLMNLFIPDMLGKDIDTSLGMLKKVLES
ncbi:MAG: SRPBCC family protein [Mucilaginibacter sp.]